MSQSKFIEIPANANSYSKRRLIHKRGINDVDYIVRPWIDGKPSKNRCPYYTKWIGMFARCYDEAHNAKYSTYKDCTVCDEWLLFSNFRLWMKTQIWEGLELDKDILVIGNKVYSPETCCFINSDLNKLIGSLNMVLGGTPIGVKIDKSRNKYVASININGKSTFLGRYSDPIDAGKIYAKFRNKELVRLAHIQNDLKIKAGLLRHAELYKNGEVD